MSSLRVLQESFLQALHSSPDSLLTSLNANSHLPQATQFNLYKNSITGNFKKALKNIYPVCCRLVGEEFFFAMSAEYIEQHPSHSRDLNQYGKNFAGFVADFPPAQSLSYLADVARLELAWHEIYSAMDAPLFDFQQFTTLLTQAPQIIFTLPPSCTLITSPYPIQQIWEINREPENSADDSIITLAENERYFLFIWRQNYAMRMESLSEQEWIILNLIQQGLSLQVICEQAETLLPDANMTQLLTAIVQRGWITGANLAL